MEEIQYYKEVYSQFWAKQTKVYGYGKYERNLVRLILRSKPEKVFEVGVGTGWPIGKALKIRGIRVDGCDVAEHLVSLAQKNLDNEKGIYTGDVMQYEGEKLYDAVYCVRASWYIPNFYETVDKMASMTKKDGVLVFDVMDRNSLYCLKARALGVLRKYYRLLGINVDEPYGTHYISVWKMKRFLRKRGLRFWCCSERKITRSSNVSHTPKVVFYVEKRSDL